MSALPMNLQKCYLCQKKMGACIQCYNRSCFTAFHVTCGRQAGLLVKSARERVDDGHGNGGSANSPHPGADDASADYAEALHAFCHRHLPENVDVLGGESVMKLKKSDDIDPFGKKGTPVIVPGREGRPPSKSKKGKNKSGVVVKKSKDGKISISITNSSSPRKAISKSARAYKKTYRVGPPLVPQFILKRVLEYVGRLTIRKKRDALLHVAKYWSLKREARRGAPLLKRLHLEVSLAASAHCGVFLTQVYFLFAALDRKLQTKGAERRGEAQEAQVHRSSSRRSREAAHARGACAEARASEAQASTADQGLAGRKDDQALPRSNCQGHRGHQEVSSSRSEPRRTNLTDLISHLRYDRQGLFLEPVDRAAVPDYYDVVKNPMNWATISDKVHEGKYQSIDDFAADINLVTDNAMLYNKPQTNFWQTASRIKKRAAEHADLLRKEIEAAHHPLDYGIIGGAGSDERDEAVEVPPAVHEELRTLGFEPGHPLIQALEDYSPEEMLASIVEDENPSTAPSNVVDDFIRLYHRYDPSQEQSGKGGKSGNTGGSANGKQRIKDKRRAAALLGIERRKQAVAEAEKQHQLKQAESEKQEHTKQAEAAKKKHPKQDVIEGEVSVNMDNGRPLRETRKRRFDEIDERDTVTPPRPPRPQPAAGSSRPAPLRQTPSETSARPSKGPSYVYQTVDDAKDWSGIPAELEADQIKENTFFKQFETGWILPEGSKRRHRPSLPPAAPAAGSQPPRPAPSASSRRSLGATERDSGRTTSAALPSSDRAKRGRSNSVRAFADAQQKEGEEEPAPTRLQRRASGRAEQAVHPSSSVLSSVIDTSDAPDEEKDEEAEDTKTKRLRAVASEAAEKDRQRRNDSKAPARTERQEEAADEEREGVHQARTQPRISGRFISTPGPPAKSKLPSEGEEEPETGYANKTEAWSSTSPPATKLAVHGTVVWAKVQPFPAHPADLIDPSDGKVPPAVRNVGKADRVLVYFHVGPKGAKRTW